MSTTRHGNGVAFLVTCEHGGNDVPPAYRHLFRGAGPVLSSHRGWDPGALSVARHLARALEAPLHVATTTRLLVDLNRSPHHPRVLSEYSRALSREGRDELLRTVHASYRGAVDARVRELGDRGQVVVHVGVHSFTPVLNGTSRQTDVALLYDPARRSEQAFGETWTGAIRTRQPALRVRRNHPYRGASDGLTTWLRSRHREETYLGLELELSQGLLARRGGFPAPLVTAVLDALREGASRTVSEGGIPGGNRPR